MKVKIPYGKEEKLLDLDKNLNVSLLKKREFRGLGDTFDIEMMKSLGLPFGTRSLSTLAKRKKDCCIVISDTTRPVPNSLILPYIIYDVRFAGIKKENITILIANGSHEPVPESMFEKLVGKEVLEENIKIINHDAYDDTQLKKIGETSSGCPAIVNKK